MKQLLLCSWAYVSCQFNAHVHFQLKTKSMQGAALFLKMGKWLWHFPQPRFLPRLGLWECPCLLDYLVSKLHISPASTSAFSAPSNSTTVSLDKMSVGLLWLGTLGRQSHSQLGKWYRISIILSLSSFADQLLRKAPRTASLSVNITFDQSLPHFHGCKHCHHFQLLDEGLLAFSHYIVKSSSVHFNTEERYDLLGHVDFHTAQTTIVWEIERGIHIYVEDFGLWRLNLSGNILSQQLPDVTKAWLGVLRQCLSPLSYMVGENFQQSSELPSKDLRTGKLESSSEFLSLTPGQHLGAKGFIQFTNKFFNSLFGVGDEAEFVTWLSQIELHSQDFAKCVEVQELVFRYPPSQ